MTRGGRYLVPVFVLLIAAASSAKAGTDPAAAPIVDALEARYHNAKTLKAIFLEVYREGQQSNQAESGTVYFSRPGRMRWEYESPESKLFLSDGKMIWFYVPADRTVTRSPIKTTSDWRTPLLLLTENVKLSRVCDKIDLSDQPSKIPGHVILRCTPRGEPKAAAPAGGDGSPAVLPSPAEQFNRVLIEVDRATGDLADVRVELPGETEIEYRFGNWVEDLPLSENLFHFDPPAGVAIVDSLGGGSAP